MDAPAVSGEWNEILSVGWESGNYPEKLKLGMENSSCVISAWDGETLAGLIRALDDGNTVAFIHYFLVRPEYQGLHIGGRLLEMLLDKYRDFLYVKVMPSDPETVPFYEKYGFVQYGQYRALEIVHME